METKNFPDLFTRPERLLLGVCAKISRQWKLPAIIPRIGFVVLSLLLVPLGVLAYLLVHLLSGKNAHYKLYLALFGGVVGLPISYYFQSDTVRAMGGGMVGYLRKFPQIVDTVDAFLGDGLEVMGTALLGTVATAMAGFLFGHLLDRRAGLRDGDGPQNP